jgi:PAS domain S-box-containing protein
MSDERARTSGDPSLLAPEHRLGQLDEIERVAGIGSYVWVVGVGAEWSDHFFRLLGLDPTVARATQKPASEIFFAAVHPDDRARVMALQADVARTGVVTPTTYRVVWPDGSIRWLTGTSAPTFGDDGKLRRIVGMIRDVTPEIEREQHIRDGARAEALATLATGVAHEINNMLTVIRGNLDLVVPHDEDDKVAFREIGAAVENTVERVRRLLELARRGEPTVATLDAVALVERFARTIDRTLGPRLEIVVDKPQGPLWIRVDGPEIEHALLNLALNARDAMPSGGRITIAVAARPADSGRVVEIGVADNGPGIPATVMSRLFTPYVTTKGPGKGTGLGLSAVKLAAQRSNGTVRVESNPDTGTRFTLAFAEVLAGA